MTHQWMEIKIKDLEKRVKVLEERDELLDKIRSEIEQLPSVSTEKTGRWITHCYQNCKCSMCGYIISEYDSEEFKFCPNCGSKMHEETETCKGCTTKCIMYEPNMKGCKDNMEGEKKMMDAVKFLNEVKRMCAMYNKDCCGCPLNYTTPYGDICRYAIMSSLTSEEKVRYVEAWSKEEAVNSAHWIVNNHKDTISCSYCHTWFNKDDRYYYMLYCPYCGVKMVEPQESEDKE